MYRNVKYEAINAIIRTENFRKARKRNLGNVFRDSS